MPTEVAHIQQNIFVYNDSMSSDYNKCNIIIAINKYRLSEISTVSINSKKIFM